MSTPPTEPPDAPTPTALGADAAKVAGGATVVLVGGIGETGLRAVTTWLLARALGPAGYGLYAATSTIVQLLASLSPLGMDGGALYFGARYRKTGDNARLRGMVQVAALVGLVAGPIAAAALWAAATYGSAWLADTPGLDAGLRVGALAVLSGTALALAVGLVQAAKDMRSHALYFQLGLPGVTLVGSAVAVAMGAGAMGAIWALAVAYTVSAVFMWRAAARHYGALLRDRTAPTLREPGVLLRYALPQSLARLLYRANLWTDVLMLTALTTLTDVGIYRTAVMIAMFGALPVMAITTMFNPIIAELVAARSLERLDGLLKIVTRWLVMLAAPGYLVVLLLPDLCLRVFDDVYVAGTGALGVLMFGQAIYVACAVSSAIIPMAGLASLNAVHGTMAFLVNLGLNALLIPLWGLEGAAVASSTALGGWSLWRVGTVWRRLRCFPFSARTLGLIGAAVVLGLVAHLAVADAGLGARVAATGAVTLLFVGGAWRWGRTPDDAVVEARLRQKLGGITAKLRRR